MYNHNSGYLVYYIFINIYAYIFWNMLISCFIIYTLCKYNYASGYGVVSHSHIYFKCGSQYTCNFWNVFVSCLKFYAYIHSIYVYRVVSQKFLRFGSHIFSLFIYVHNNWNICCRNFKLYYFLHMCIHVVSICTWINVALWPVFPFFLPYFLFSCLCQ